LRRWARGLDTPFLGIVPHQDISAVIVGGHYPPKPLFGKCGRRESPGCGRDYIWGVGLSPEINGPSLCWLPFLHPKSPWTFSPLGMFSVLYKIHSSGLKRISLPCAETASILWAYDSPPCGHLEEGPSTSLPCPISSPFRHVGGVDDQNLAGGPSRLRLRSCVGAL